ncbi:MAG: hypothetical protein CMC94_00055 [Flavobacteriales bacterium]|nr:hypothetical protein [Flavobacteriales bacterium]
MRFSIPSKFLLSCLLFLSTAMVFSQAIKVEVVQKDGQWQLTRGGEPYYIKGAGGDTHLDELVAAGGNSIRTWSADGAQEVLDRAHAHGLTVMFGLWVQHERHGYDYDNEAANRAQLEYFTSVVKKYKDHPALLMWSIGNEVDLFYSNTKVWDVVQDIAKMVHEVDPNHPTTTVTAGLDPIEVKLVQQQAPDIDIYSINTYGEVCIIKDLIRTAGWEKAYIVAEWGPDGHWEVAKTRWSSPVEQTSHEKALSYSSRYNDCILPDTEKCIGSYVFLWGQKQETTATWYGLFSMKGQSTEVIDYVSHGWTGKWPNNRAPSLDSLSLNNQQKGEDIYLTAEEMYSANVFASDDQNKIKYSYKIYPESVDTKSGGDLEKEPPAMPGLIKKKSQNQVEFRAPKEEGGYRLFVYVTDNEDKIAYANIPFYVNPRKEGMPQSTPVKLKTRKLSVPQ